MSFIDIFDFEKRRFEKAVQETTPYRDEFFEARKRELKERVDTKRYNHTMGVIKVAKLLAETYDVNENKACLAALLHDWDKCYTDDEMRTRIYDVGADMQTTKEVIENMPKTLHGLTAAFALGIEYPGIPADVLRAIMVHTTADDYMGKLDMVIYIADALDPGRDYPEYEELFKLIGEVSLKDLFVRVYGESTVAVIRKGKMMHPKTVEIWNKLIEDYYNRHPEMAKKKFKKQNK